MQHWKRVDNSTSKTQAGFRTVVHKQFVMNNGQTMNADILNAEKTSAAGVIALTSDKRVVIAKQFRCGPEDIMYEMPGGAVDAGETPEIAARRELREETGFEPGRLEYLGAAYVNAWDNSIHHYFLATDCYAAGSPHPEQFEEVEVETIGIREFIDNAMNARMTDAQGVLLAYEKLKELERSV